MSKRVSSQTKPRKVYVAGGMTGIPFHNFPAFDTAAESLRRRGFTVVSPAELDDPETRALCLGDPTGSNEIFPRKRTWSQMLARDLRVIAGGVTDIAVLPGWDYSRGAKLETFFACLLGLDIRYARSMRKVPTRRLIRAFGSVVDADHELLSVAANR